MKKTIFITMLWATVFWSTAWAQQKQETGDVITKETQVVAEATTINSDRLQLDLAKQLGVFIGNVHVSNPRFEMKAKEVMVYFSNNNRPERFVAKGDVAIKHGDRTSTSRQAEYTLSDKKIVLTGDPVVMQNQNRVTGSVITIFPDQDRMDVQGRTTVHLMPQ